MSDLKAH